jgi:hypothetical protein
VEETKIQKSKKEGKQSKKYNRKYERCMTEEILEYLGERVERKEK